MKKDDTVLAWIIIGLSILVVGTVLQSVAAFGSGFVSAQIFIIFFSLIPIGTAAYYFGSKETFWVSSGIMFLCGAVLCWPQIKASPLSSWPGAQVDPAYITYVLKPITSTGIIWQLLSFVLVGTWAGLVLSELQKSSEQTQEAGRVKKQLGANLQEQKDFFSALETRYRKDTNRLGSLIISLSELAREIPSVLEVDALFSLILNKTVKLFSASQCAIFKVDSINNKLHLICSYGYDEGALKRVNLTADEESGILGWCAKNGKFLSVIEAKSDFHMVDLLRNQKIETLFCQPVVRRGEVIAVICVGQAKTEMEQKEIMRVSGLLGNLTAIAIENAQLIEKIREQAVRDGLTGLYNHRFFQESLQKRLKQAEEKKKPLGLFLLDVDYFKKFNDTYGHQAGDFILQEVAKIFKSQMGPEDLAARYGGEEFVAIISCVDKKSAVATAENIREKVEKTIFKTGEVKLNVAVSLGGAIYDPSKNAKIDKGEFIKKADEALYRAKENGRNRVEC